MKKGTIWLAPLGALLVFTFFYMQSRDEFQAHADALKKQKAEEIRLKNEETERRNKAAAQARKEATDAKNKADADEKIRKDNEAKHLEELQYSLEFARREAARYDNVVKDLTESFKTEKDAQKVAEKAVADMRDEKKFIAEYVAKAQANEKALKELLQKLERIEKERIEAAKLAAKS